MTGFGGMYNSFKMQEAVAEARAKGRSAARGEASTRKQQRGIDAIEERIDKLLLVSMAVWELLKERTSLTEDDLQAKVHELDMRDGVVDGKVTRTLKKCYKCSRTMSPRHRKCLYCGAEELQNEAFDAAK